MSNSNFYFRDGKYFQTKYVATGAEALVGSPIVEAGDDYYEVHEREEKELPSKQVIEALENWL